MKTSKHIFRLSVVLGLMLLVGCAKMPQQAIDGAKAALDAAKTAQADRYVGDKFNAAQDSLNKAMTEIEAQKSKSAFSRNYGHAKKLLEFVTTTANAAKDEVPAKKEQFKTEVQNSITKVQSGLSDAKALLRKAPTGKEGRAALQAIQADLTTVENSLTEVSTFITKGDFASARDKVNAAMNKVNSLKTELENAIAKYSATIKKR